LKTRDPDNVAPRAPLAQLAEQLTLNQRVGGSIPSRRTTFLVRSRLQAQAIASLPVNSQLTVTFALRDRGMVALTDWRNSDSSDEFTTIASNTTAFMCRQGISSPRARGEQRFPRPAAQHGPHLSESPCLSWAGDRRRLQTSRPCRSP
jgi:hypothetical protein